MRKRISWLLSFMMIFGGDLFLAPVRPRAAQDASTSAVAPPSITHDPLSCMVSNEFPRVDAEVTSLIEVKRTRVYFKAHQYPDWYYVDMKTVEAAQYLALLPQPLPETKQLDYYVHALDIGVRSSQTETYVPAVITPGPCGGRAVPAWTGPAEIIIGGTKKDQRPIPPGFSKKGIIAFVTVTGAMITGSALLGGSGGGAMAAGGKGGAGAGGSGGGIGGASGAGGGGGGIGSTALALLGGSALVAGGAVAVIAASEGKTEPTPAQTPNPLDQDDDRDGYSENQGDCNDQSSSIRPNGTVTVTVTDSRAGRNVPCGEAWTKTYRLVNNSCQTVNVNDIVEQIESPQSQTGHSLPTDPEYPHVSVKTVASGTTADISEERQSYSYCSMSQRTTYLPRAVFIVIVHPTVHTSVGALDAGSYQYMIDALNCPLCD